MSLRFRTRCHILLHLAPVLLFLFVSLPAAFAQNKYGGGYYVTPQRDTVQGFIQYKENFLKTVPFRKDLKAPVQQLSGNEAVAFGFTKGNHFELVNFPDQGQTNVVYARKVVAGKVNLYKYYGKFIIGSDSTRYLTISKVGGGSAEERLATVQKNTGAMNIVMFDCPSALEKATKAPVDEDHLITSLRDYHDCTHNAYKVYVASPSKRVSFSLFTFLNMAKLSFSGDDESLNATPFERSTNPGLGALMLLKPSSKQSSIFYLQLELLYHSMSFSGNSYLERSVSGYDFKYTAYTTVDIQRLAPRVGFRLHARSNVLNPYFSAGVSGPSLLPAKSGMQKEVQINDDTQTYDTKPVEKVGMGWWVSAGLKRPFKNGNALFADINYESLSTDMGGKITAVSPRIGFIF